MSFKNYFLKTCVNLYFKKWLGQIILSLLPNKYFGRWKFLHFEMSQKSIGILIWPLFPPPHHHPLSKISMCSKTFMNKESIQDSDTWANFHSTGFLCTCRCQTTTLVSPKEFLIERGLHSKWLPDFTISAAQC